MNTQTTARQLVTGHRVRGGSVFLTARADGLLRPGPASVRYIACSASGTATRRSVTRCLRRHDPQRSNGGGAQRDALLHVCASPGSAGSEDSLTVTGCGAGPRGRRVEQHVVAVVTGVVMPTGLPCVYTRVCSCTGVQRASAKFANRLQELRIKFVESTRLSGRWVSGRSVGPRDTMLTANGIQPHRRRHRGPVADRHRQDLGLLISIFQMFLEQRSVDDASS